MELLFGFGMVVLGFGIDAIKGNQRCSDDRFKYDVWNEIRKIGWTSKDDQGNTLADLILKKHMTYRQAVWEIAKQQCQQKGIEWDEYTARASC